MATRSLSESGHQAASIPRKLSAYRSSLPCLTTDDNRWSQITDMNLCRSPQHRDMFFLLDEDSGLTIL